MTMARRFLLVAAMLAACGEPGSVEAQQTNRGASLFAAAPEAQWTLPNRLSEISGLAISPDGRLFAHDDERAVIYELNAANGEVIKSFSLGNPVETGDFEGLAITPDGIFWMTTSRGRTYRFSEGADGAATGFETFDAGLEETCEIEGLAYAPSEQSLIFACKRNRARGMRDRVSMYRWSFSGAAELWRELPESSLADAAGVKDFRPSSIDFDPATERILLLSANDGAFAELDADGGIITVRALDRSHAQPEGLAVLPDGALIISDEASGGRPTLTRYGRTP